MFRPFLGLCIPSLVYLRILSINKYEKKYEDESRECIGCLKSQFFTKLANEARPSIGLFGLYLANVIYKPRSAVSFFQYIIYLLFVQHKVPCRAH